jgi:protein-L-isoaspartate(D-aspartate) O-methyltransferase
MADRLRGWDGEALPPAVDAALRAVPRGSFVPGTPLAEAYGSGPVVTHRDKDGVARSSASAPGVVAAMLAQLDVRLGHRILEIGAGTGYNVALLAHLAEPSGKVTTVELDPGIAAEAGKALAATGYGRVTVIAGDGENGPPPTRLTTGSLSLPAPGSYPAPGLTSSLPAASLSSLSGCAASPAR